MAFEAHVRQCRCHMRALAFTRYLHAGGPRRRVHAKNIGAAAAIVAIKAISAICVEEFDPPTWHCSFSRGRFNAHQTPRRAYGAEFGTTALPPHVRSPSRAGHANTNLSRNHAGWPLARPANLYRAPLHAPVPQPSSSSPTSNPLVADDLTSPLCSVALCRRTRHANTS